MQAAKEKDRQDPTKNRGNMSTFYGTHNSFNIELAREYGINAAILIHHFQKCIGFSYSSKINFHEGKYWARQSIKEIAAHLPELTIRSIRTVLSKLVDKKVLIKGNFNKNKYDHTAWYAFTDGSFLGG